MPNHHEIRERIDDVAAIEGRGTELVTVAVPPEATVRSVRERVDREHAGAANVRSDRTRQRVRRALDRVRRILRQYRGVPENGLVVYAGVVDGELVSHVFDDLPRPVAGSTYRCDDHFDVGPLEAAVAPGETFGLVVLERGRAAVGRLVGERVVPVRNFESRVMGASRAGGQSAKRFERERERQAHEFYERVARVAGTAFLGDNSADGIGGSAASGIGGDAADGVATDPVDGLVVGGTLGTAKRFVDGDYLDHRLQDRLLGTYAVEYATERGLQQLVEKAEAELLDAGQRETRRRLDEFFSRLRDDGSVAYGEDVERAIEFGAVETALVAATVPRERRAELETSISEQGGETVVVPVETDRGRQFERAFGGLGALLRFPVRE